MGESIGHILDSLIDLQPAKLPWEAFRLAQIKKFLLNICINPLTALLEINNGGLANNTHIQAVQKVIIEEAVDVLKANSGSEELNRHLDAEKLYQAVVDDLPRLGKNISSMCADVRNHQEDTEM